MKNLLLALLTFAFLSTSAKDYTWNGDKNNSWNEPTNWTPKGIPDHADNVIITSNQNRSLHLDKDRSIKSITVITYCTIQLKGHILKVDSLILINNGIIDNGTFESGTLVGDKLKLVSIENTDISSDIAITSEQWNNIKYNSFHGEVAFTHIGNQIATIEGGNHYHNNVRYTTEFSSFSVEKHFNSDYSGKFVHIVNSSEKGVLSMGENCTTTINTNIIVDNLNNGTIQFGSDNPKCQIGLNESYIFQTNEFARGNLVFNHVIQNGLQNISLFTESKARIYFNDCIWKGAVTAESGGLYVANSTFNNDVSFIKSGTYHDGCSNDNYFEKKFTLTLVGIGQWDLANN